MIVQDIPRNDLPAAAGSSGAKDPVGRTTSRRGSAPLPLHASAHARLVRAVEAGEPVIVLVGPDGVGKTTLLNAALSGDDARRQVLRLGNWLGPSFSLDDLLAQLGAERRESSDDTLQSLLRVLRAGRDEAVRLVVAVEEADTLEEPALLLLGLLPSLPAAGLPRIQVVLVGGPALQARLAGERFGRLREQVSTEIVLGPLSDAEAGAYVRWQCRARAIAGPGVAALAIDGIVSRAGGIPARLDENLEAALDASGAHGRSASPAAPQRVAGGRAGAAGKGVAPLRLVVSRPAMDASGGEESRTGGTVDRQVRHPALGRPERRARARLFATTAALATGLCAALAMVVASDHATLRPSAGAAAVSPPGLATAPGGGPDTAELRPGAAAAFERAEAVDGPPPDAAAALPRPDPPAGPQHGPRAPAPGADAADGTLPPAPLARGAAAGGRGRPAAGPRDEAEVARLRRDFDAFLARQGGAVARLSEARRRELFREYLGWRDKQAQR